MKAFISSLIVSLFVGLSAQGAFANQNPDIWFQCKNTKDCVKKFGLCGIPEAVNKKYVKDHSSAIARDAPLQSCAEHAPEAAKMYAESVPKCFEGKCEMGAPSHPPAPAATSK